MDCCLPWQQHPRRCHMGPMFWPIKRSSFALPLHRKLVATKLLLPMTKNEETDPQKASELVKSKGYKYLDVRTPEEFKESHVEGSINVPVVFLAGGDIEHNPHFLQQVEALLPDKGAALVVGCRSGRRSAMASEALSQAGYTHLTNLAGGIDAWKAAQLPLVTGPGFQKITTKEGGELVSKGATYLDVRTNEEYASGHAPGALHVPVAVNVGGSRQANDQFVQQVRAAIPNPATELCVACMGGGRAESAAEQLAAAGYTNVKQMTDGYRGWAANGLPLQKL